MEGDREQDDRELDREVDDFLFQGGRMIAEAGREP
jgi:hypothetical protein